MCISFVRRKRAHASARVFAVRKSAMNINNLDVAPGIVVITAYRCTNYTQLPI